MTTSRFSFFLFNDTATTEIYTLSLHDALPICSPLGGRRTTAYEARHFTRVQHTRPEAGCGRERIRELRAHAGRASVDRKSTRLNSSHANISYAVFCLKKNTRLPLPILPSSLSC